MEEELLLRYINRETTEEDTLRVLTWLDEDPKKHLAELNRIKYMCSILDLCGTQMPAKKNVPRVGFLHRTMRYAAIAAASVVVVLGVWQVSHYEAYREISDHVSKLEVPAGQRLNITLDDGTCVRLNAGARLEYPPVFGNRDRRVKLSGEAMFEVKHETKRPFIVETFASEIKVLGTKFNVVADAERALFRTTLVQGSVKVTSRTNPTEVIMMQPYDVVELDGQHLAKQQVLNFDNLCWTEGLFYIEAMPFEELMRRFETAYNVKIDIERSTLPEIKVRSGKVRISDGIDYALEILQQVSDFDYERDEHNQRVVIH